MTRPASRPGRFGSVLRARHVGTATMVALAIVALGAPFGVTLTTVASLELIAIFCLITLGMNFVIEMTGLVSLGQAGIVAAGGYGTMIAVVRLGVPALPAIVLGTALAGVVGLILAIPSVRVKNLYFAIVTIIFGSSISSVVNLLHPATGGQAGLYATPGGLIGYGGTVAVYWIAVGTLIVSLFACHAVEHSRVGHALRAAKHHPEAAATLGINVRRHQIIAVTVGNVLTGLGGCLLALQTGGVSPESYTLEQSTLYLVAAVVGGTGTVLGAVLGGFFVQGLSQWLSGASVYLDIIFGALLLVSLVFLPGGLAGGIARIGGLLWPVPGRRAAAVGDETTADAGAEPQTGVHA